MDPEARNRRARVFSPRWGFLPVLLLVVLTVASGGRAWGQFPSRPVELVAWAAPGGGSDRMCRVLARAARGILPQRVYVVNKGGAGGAVGMGYVQSRPADGHTLLGVTNNLVLTPLTRPGFRYNSKDFDPLVMWGFDVKVVAVRADGPYRTIEDLVAAARRQPGALKIGTFGLGTDDHVVGYLLGKATGGRFGFVPFDGGGEQLAALLGGHVDAHISEVSEVKAQVDAGAVRVIAVASARRLKELPQVPTLREKGWDIVLPKFRGLVARRGIPGPVREYLISVFREVVATPLFQAYLEDNMIEPELLAGADFRRLIEQQEREFKTVLRELGF